jgi:hypothetical protein
MKATTTDIHESLKTLGRALGMYADGEVSDSLLRVRLSGDAAYRPRIVLVARDIRVPEAKRPLSNHPCNESP